MPVNIPDFVELNLVFFTFFCLDAKESNKEKIKAYEKYVAFLCRRYRLAIQGMKDSSKSWLL